MDMHGIKFHKKKEKLINYLIRMGTKMKINILAFFTYLTYILTSLSSIHANEIICDRMIIDRQPLSISWIHESENFWILEAIFEKGIIKTYFRKEPPNKGMGLSIHNKPIRQEFEYYSDESKNRKKVFTSEIFEYTQCLNGAKIFSFKFENQIINIDGHQFELSGTSVIDEVGEGEDSVSYTFFKN